MTQETSRAEWRVQIRRALSFIKPYAVPVSIILVLNIIASALGTLNPLLWKYVTDGLMADNATVVLKNGILGMIALALGKQVAGGITNWLNWKTRIGIQLDIQATTVRRLHALPMKYHKQESVGGLMTKLDRGVNGLVGALTEIAFNVIPTIAYLVIALKIMFTLDWRLALLLSALAPLPAIVGILASREQTAREKELMNRWTRIYARFNETLGAIQTVKSFAMELRETRRFLWSVRKSNDIVIRGVGIDTGTGAAKNLIVEGATISAFALGGWLVIRGEITVGTLLAFIGYVGSLFGPVTGLTGIYQTLRRAAVSLDIIYSILDAEDDLKDAPDAKDVTHVQGEVQFDNVSFAYRDEEKVIDSVNLVVRPGETVALVGPSGAGKSTMMALLQRLYDPTEGAIRVDGQDVRTLKQRSLRKHIGVVLQEAVLFNDTVRANIAYAKPHASMDEVIAAAKAANAHSFIMKLPDGYDTVVGERGGILSGGQKQRIAIARAILKNPAILVLDEATSALDAESESLVQQALERLMEERTTFVIAHRLSTVVNADRILVMKDGQIMESGTHAELIRQGGHYASLVEKQTEALVTYQDAA